MSILKKYNFIMLSIVLIFFSMMYGGCGKKEKSLVDTVNALAGQEASYDTMGKTYKHKRYYDEDRLKSYVKYLDLLMKDPSFQPKRDYNPSGSVSDPWNVIYEKDRKLFNAETELKNFSSGNPENINRIIRYFSREKEILFITKKDGVYVTKFDEYVDFYLIKPDNQGKFSSIKKTNFIHFEPPLDKDYLIYYIPKYKLLIADKLYFMSNDSYWIDQDSSHRKLVWILISFEDVIKGYMNNTFPYKHNIGLSVVDGLRDLLMDLPIIQGYKTKREADLEYSRNRKVAWLEKTGDDEGQYIEVLDMRDEPEFYRYEINLVKNGKRTRSFIWRIPKRDKQNWKEFQYTNEILENFKKVTGNPMAEQISKIIVDKNFV